MGRTRFLIFVDLGCSQRADVSAQASCDLLGDGNGLTDCGQLFDIKTAFVSVSFHTKEGYLDTMAANMKKSSPWSLPIFLSLLPSFVKVAKHITTRVSHAARLINGPRLSGVTVTCSGCSGDILVLLQPLTFLGRIHEKGVFRYPIGRSGNSFHSLEGHVIGFIT